MCGIIGFTGEVDAKEALLDGLQSLEYRGYDSSGIAVQCADGIKIYKAEGKLQNLKDNIKNCSGTIYIIGNGGSSSIASHACNDILKSFKKKSFNLTDNVATFSAYSNDISYEDALKEILKDILKSDDLLICLSTSGKSKNILKAFEYSKDICKTVLITGNKTEISDFVIDSSDTQILEDCFGAIFHCICKL